MLKHLKSIPQVKDSNEQLESYQKTWYDNAIASGDSGEYDNAIKILEALKSYKDSSDLVTYYKLDAMNLKTQMMIECEQLQCTKKFQR